MMSRAILKWWILVLLIAMGPRVHSAPLPSLYNYILEFTGTDGKTTIGFYSATKCFIDRFDQPAVVADYTYQVAGYYSRVSAKYDFGGVTRHMFISLFGFFGTPGSYHGQFVTYLEQADGKYVVTYGTWQQTSRYGFAPYSPARTYLAMNIAESDMGPFPYWDSWGWEGYYFYPDGVFYNWEPSWGFEQVGRWKYTRTGKDSATIGLVSKDGSYHYFVMNYTAYNAGNLSGFHWVYLTRSVNGVVVFSGWTAQPATGVFVRP